MEEIMAAVALLQSGERDAARTELLALWVRHEGDGTPIARCTLAHFLADTSGDVAEELAWDLAALRAATAGVCGEDRDALGPELAAFLPSLHLNLGDALRRSGDDAGARVHAGFGLGRAGALPPGGYGDTIRTGLERLLARSGG